MGRKNTSWIMILFMDKQKKEIFKVLEFNTLKEIAYVMNKNIYDVTNFYHEITKPKKLFNYINIYQSEFL
tara:strand:+ start:426 stop:635 length:210 start_codon:yes stop_codon:yes gene_type:complete